MSGGERREERAEEEAEATKDLRQTEGLRMEAVAESMTEAA